MEINKVISLREFKIKGIRCVVVKNDDELLGFYVGCDDDWSDGIVTRNDLKSLQEIKRDISSHCVDED
jgi:hypothetical protein